MFHLLEIVLALGVLTASELGVESGVELPWAVALLVLVPYALRRAGRPRSARGERRAAHLPVVLYALAVWGLGWRASVERWMGEAPSLLGWPGLALLVAMAPFALYAVAAIDARARFSGVPPDLRRRFRSFELRALGVTALPFVLYFTISGLVGLVPALGVRVEEISVWNAAFAGACVLSFLALLPVALRRAPSTRSLSAGPVRLLFDEVAERAGFRCRDLLVWRTGQLVANAAVVGIGARLRVVLVSDALLAQLSSSELRAVFAHEIGHARRHHVLVFLAWSVGFLGLVDVGARALDPDGEALAMGVLGVGLLLWYLGFGWLSRRFELDADLFGLELTGDPSGLSNALARLDGGLHTRGGWRHFSPLERAAFLARAAAEPGFAAAFKRRLRWIARLGLALFLVSATLEISAVIEAFPVERAVARQRLGESSTARAEVEQLASDERDLSRLIERAEGEALLALDEERMDDALSWLALAESAGDERLARVARALDAWRRGDVLRARGILGAQADDWIARPPGAADSPGAGPTE